MHDTHGSSRLTPRRVGLAVALSLGLALPAAGQPPAQAGQPPAQTQTEAQAEQMPPAGSAPVVRFIQLQFHPTNQSVIDPQTYLYYIHTRPSSSAEGRWEPYNEQTVLEDFRRLWATSFLDNLWIEVTDAPYPNGVIGKHIIYHMEERQRVKIVDYVGSKKVEVSKIDEKLREENLVIRLDSFIDPSKVQRVANIVRGLYGEKGYEYAQVKPEITELPGGPKLVHLSFVIDQGPKVRIRDVDFVGNKAYSDGKLESKMKENKAAWFFSFISGRGTYQEAKFADDADKIVEFYRDNGYIAAQVGQPELKVIEDSADGQTRWVQLQVPVTEGERYKVGKFDFAGNKVVKTEALKPLFKVKPGEYYSEKDIRKGLEKAREIYGAGGFFEFTAYPDLEPRDKPASDQDGPTPTPPRAAAAGPPIVDVTMRVQEGKQYFVNRITFLGNNTTHDNVIRREMRLYEGGVFNTEALKFSIKRLNQLGYFKQLEGDAIDVQKTPGKDNQVDVNLKLEEQNRNQLTFGAGVSQYEGFFGQLAFQTSNFMGRGETFSISAQQGSRAKNYQLGFTEPFLFDRPITGGVSLFIRDFTYPYQFTQSSRGGNIVFGFPVADFTRMFMNYSYEQVQVKDINPLYLDPNVLARNPFLADSLLVGEGGRRTISKITPSLVHNTIDNPIFATTGRRYTASFDFAGLGGNTQYVSPTLEGVWYFAQTKRTSFGLRAQWQYIRPYGDTRELPIFEKLYLGGEYSIRGFDIRSIGPRDPVTGVVIGGNKTVLFNAEYLIQIAGPVRLVLFYDAGQVRDVGEHFAWKEPVTVAAPPDVPVLRDPFTLGTLTDPNAILEAGKTTTIGETYAFKTSSGAEIRFFMPVLNVPFRLIFAYNGSRANVLNNQLQPQKKFTFRFAVGSTF
jgi:outer membrane protein insertion porin family